MNIASVETWFVCINNSDISVSSVAELRRQIAHAKDVESGRLSVCIDAGPRPWWHRFFGAERYTVSLFALEWYDQYASLIFHDEDWSEYRSIDRDQPVAPDGEVRIKIAHGEVKPHPIDECMRKERAFSAVNSYLESGIRPGWLSYRYIA